MISGTIGEILAHKSEELWRIAPEASVFEAIQLMADKNIGAVLVMRGNDLLGVMSERDYTRKVALKGKSTFPPTSPVRLIRPDRDSRFWWGTQNRCNPLHRAEPRPHQQCRCAAQFPRSTRQPRLRTT